MTYIYLPIFVFFFAVEKSEQVINKFRVRMAKEAWRSLLTKFVHTTVVKLMEAWKMQ